MSSRFLYVIKISSSQSNCLIETRKMYHYFLEKNVIATIGLWTFASWLQPR